MGSLRLRFALIAGALLFVASADAGVGTDPVPPPLVIQPNPFHYPSGLTLHLQRGNWLLRVRELPSGKLVRTLADRPLSGGTLFWDGTDDYGTPLRAGNY